MANVRITEPLDKIRRALDMEAILSQEVDSYAIIEHYTRSHPSYELLNSLEDSEHLALNYEGKFDSGFTSRLVMNDLLHSGIPPSVWYK